MIFDDFWWFSHMSSGGECFAPPPSTRGRAVACRPQCVVMKWNERASLRFSGTKCAVRVDFPFGNSRTVIMEVDKFVCILVGLRARCLKPCSVVVDQIVFLHILISLSHAQLLCKSSPPFLLREELNSTLICFSCVFAIVHWHSSIAMPLSSGYSCEFLGYITTLSRLFVVSRFDDEGWT